MKKINVLLVPEGERAKIPVGVEKVKYSKDVTEPKVTQELVEEKSEVVDRKKVSDESKTAFRDAKTADDLQAQLDIVFEILTGEEP